MTLKVSVTGARGFLGGRVATGLAAAGHAVRLLTRHTQDMPSWSAGMEVLAVDIQDQQTLIDGLRGSDAVVHLAAMNAQESAADPKAAERVNVVGTKNTVEAVQSVNARRLLYISTAHVYGAPLQGLYQEETPTTNRHPYAETHRRAEDLVCSAEDIEGVVLRLSNGVGAPMDRNANCWMLIANDLCRQVAETGALKLRGTGYDRRDFVPVSEVVRAINMMVANKASVVNPKLFNLAAGFSISTLDLAYIISDRAEALFNVRPEIDYAPDDGNRPAGPTLDTKRLSRMGFEVASDLSDEIDSILVFCRDEFGHA